MNGIWVNEFRRNLESRDVGFWVLLDLIANQTTEADPFLLLASEVKHERGHLIDDPDITLRSAHNRSFHQLPMENGIPVPETAVVDRNEIGSFKIAPGIKERMGAPLVVKPARDDSGVSLVVDAGR